MGKSDLLGRDSEYVEYINMFAIISIQQILNK